jgi:hypothetical protein
LTGQSFWSYVWVLVTAGLATEYDETSWYIDEIKGTMVKLRMTMWNEAIVAMRSILWIGETFKVRNSTVKNLFELSAV